MGMELAFLKAHRADALVAQKGCCKYCFQPLPRSRATADHRRPKAAGGFDGRENIVAACFACNQVKGKMAEAAFVSAIAAPTPRHSVGIWLTWSRRSINIALHGSHKRLLKACGASYHGPRLPAITKTRRAA